MRRGLSDGLRDGNGNGDRDGHGHEDGGDSRDANATVMKELVRRVEGSGDLFKYVRGADVLVAVGAKAGSTSFWAWVYSGLFGRAFNCSTYIQNFESPCWAGRVVVLEGMEAREQVRLLTGRTLRVAVWREPTERLVSAWKSKFACGNVYGTDESDRLRFVPQLRKLAGVEGGTCMSIGEFSECVERVREKIGRREVGLLDVNAHIRPLDYLWGEVVYDLIVKVDDLSKKGKLWDVGKRLKYRTFARRNLPHLHKSRGEAVDMDDDVKIRIQTFADLITGSPFTSHVYPS